MEGKIRVDQQERANVQLTGIPKKEEREMERLESYQRKNTGTFQDWPTICAPRPQSKNSEENENREDKAVEHPPLLTPHLPAPVGALTLRHPHHMILFLLGKYLGVGLLN